MFSPKYTDVLASQPECLFVDFSAVAKKNARKCKKDKLSPPKEEFHEVLVPHDSRCIEVDIQVSVLHLHPGKQR